MKIKSFFIISLLFFIVPLTLQALTDPAPEDTRSIQIGIMASQANDMAVENVIAAPSALPRGPQDVINDYQTEMAGITERFSAKVAAIAQAVQGGQLSSEQGQELTTEQYQMAQMQFELLSAWRDMLAGDLARTPVIKVDSAAPDTGQIVMAALPFSSFELNPSLAQYLDLTASQSKAIEQVMADERRDIQPLMEKMRSNRERLMAATAAGQGNEKEVKVLATTQAGMLEKLIVANSRMQARIYKLLNREQQKKLDAFKKASDPMIASK
jgi:Skp family chaperone for outer membrane proteins